MDEDNEELGESTLFSLVTRLFLFVCVLLSLCEHEP